MDEVNAVAEKFQENCCRILGASSFAELQNMGEKERRELVKKAKKQRRGRAIKVNTIMSGNPYLMLGLKIKARSR